MDNHNFLLLVKRQIDAYEVSCLIKDNKIRKLTEQLRLERVRSRDYRKGIRRLKQKIQKLENEIDSSKSPSRFEDWQ